MLNGDKQKKGQFTLCIFKAEIAPLDLIIHLPINMWTGLLNFFKIPFTLFHA